MENKDYQKRVAAIHDLSGFGKCSLTVALPILSAAGIEACAMPTAILSTHTGGISGYTYRDLTSDMRAFMQHWKSLDIQFDATYSGFLGSFEQLDLVKEFFELFRSKNNLILVDPVMADNGKLYPGFDGKIVEAMRKLCKKADIITPNITEASLLTADEYREAGAYDEDYIKKTLVKLTELGPKTAAITGVRYESAPDKQGVVGYDRESGEFSSYYEENLPVSCHGTGDVFASTMFAALLREKNLLEAEKIAVEMTVDCIRHTIGDKEHWYSVKFEECIPDLIKML